MSASRARTTLLLLVLAPAAWSVVASWVLGERRLTTSYLVNAHAGQWLYAVWLHGALCFAVARDAFPVMPWGWLLFVTFAGGCVGHALWVL